MALLKYQLPPSKGILPKLEYQYLPEYISDCENVYLSDTGACLEITELTRSFTSTDEQAQIFDTHVGTYVLTASTLYYREEDGTLTSKLTSFTTGDRWSCADFGNYLVFTNGAVNLIRNIYTGAFSNDTSLTFPVSNAICAHRGRLLAAGSLDYAYNFLEINPAYYTLPGYVRDKIHNNFVVWSKINDLTFQKFNNVDNTNLAGYMPVEYSGQIMRLEPLKDKVIVYGENGVSAFYLGGTGYGQTTIHTTGIKGSFAVCVNSTADGITEHYFVDKSGEFCRVNADTSVNKLGYRNLFGSGTAFG